MQVGREDEVRVSDPVHDGTGLGLYLCRVLLEKVWEVPVEVEIVGVESGSKKKKINKNKKGGKSEKR